MAEWSLFINVSFAFSGTKALARVEVIKLSLNGPDECCCFTDWVPCRQCESSDSQRADEHKGSSTARCIYITELNFAWFPWVTWEFFFWLSSTIKNMIEIIFCSLVIKIQALSQSLLTQTWCSKGWVTEISYPGLLPCRFCLSCNENTKKFNKHCFVPTCTPGSIHKQAHLTRL